MTEPTSPSHPAGPTPAPVATAPVRAAAPPSGMFKVANVLMRALIRSPLHGALKGLLLLEMTGRRSGRRVRVPVGHHHVDGQHLVVTSGHWRHNLRGGAPVAAWTDGRRRTGRAELIEDPDEVARLYGAILAQVGLRNARQLGLRATGDRLPTFDELKTALPGHAAVRLLLDDERGGAGGA